MEAAGIFARDLVLVRLAHVEGHDHQVPLLHRGQLHLALLVQPPGPLAFPLAYTRWAAANVAESHDAFVAHLGKPYAKTQLLTVGQRCAFRSRLKPVLGTCCKMCRCQEYLKREWVECGESQLRFCRSSMQTPVTRSVAPLGPVGLYDNSTSKTVSGF